MKTIIRSISEAMLIMGILAGAALGQTVPVVHNEGEPLLGERTVDLETVWTLGESDEDLILGTIERVLVLDDARVLLLDSQLSRIVECAADGKVLRTLGRAGSGPGEMTEPKDMVCLSDGTLGLISTFPGRLVFLNPDDTPAGSITPTVVWAVGGFMTLHRALSSGETLFLGGSSMTMDPNTPVQKRTFFLGSFDREGNMIAEILRGEASFDIRTNELHESWQEFVWQRMAVSSDGTVVVGIPRDEFELSWFSSDGTALLKATLPVKPWKRNQKAHDRMFGILDYQARHVPGTKAVVAETEPTIVDLSVQENGDVWCLTSRSMWESKDGVFATYDVFNEAGQYQERIRVICPGDATRDRLMFAGDRFFRIAGYWDAVFKVQSETPDPDAEPMSVTCYRVR